MNSIKMVMIGLMVTMFVASNAMNQRIDQEALQTAIRRLDDPYYMRLEQAIHHGQEYTFMEILNDMDVNGHSLDGDDYDALKLTARNNGFNRFGIMEDPVYQRLSAAVLRDDTTHFIGNFADMTMAGHEVSDDHLYWLTDLAIRAESPDVKYLLDMETRDRNLVSN